MSTISLNANNEQAENAPSRPATLMFRMAEQANRNVRRLIFGPQRRSHVNSQVRDGLVQSVFDGGLYSVAAAMLAGAYVTGYALHLGFEEFHIGLLGAIPMLAGLTGLLGSWMANAMGSRRIVTLWTTGLGRLLWAPLIVLPFCGLSEGALIWAVIVCYGASSLLQGVAAGPWLSWMSDLVPESIRGRFWGRRNEVVQLMSAAGLLLAGVVMDAFVGWELELWGYVAIFSIGLLFAVASWRRLHKQHDPPRTEPKGTSLIAGVRTALAATSFRKLLVATAAYNFAVGLCAAFVAPYMLQDLGMSFKAISGWSVYSLIIGFLASRVWGKAMDKYGVRPVMKINLVLASLTPGLWILTYDFGWWMMALNWTIAGAGWAGYSLAALNWAFAFAPREGRSYALSLPGIVAGLSFFAASTLAGVIAGALPDFLIELGPLTLVPLHVLLFLSLVGRFIGMRYYLKLKDVASPGAKPILTMNLNLHYTRWMNVSRVARGYFFADEEPKEKAAK